MALGNNIKINRLKLGLTLENLSDLSGVDVGTIHALEARDSSRSKYATAIARGLGMSLEDLESGAIAKTLVTQDDSGANVTTGPVIKGSVPVISWVQAGAWAEIIDNFSLGDAEDWLPCPVSHSDKTFVLRVRGESMYNPASRPSFQEGDMIFVDPEKTAEHGSLVVVRMDDSNEATFKKLVIEGRHRYLRALNPAWPEPIIQINGDATICGVVIFKGEKI